MQQAVFWLSHCGASKFAMRQGYINAQFVLPTDYSGAALTRKFLDAVTGSQWLPPFGNESGANPSVFYE
jgi:hypothetical protein